MQCGSEHHSVTVFLPSAHCWALRDVQIAQMIMINLDEQWVIPSELHTQAFACCIPRNLVNVHIDDQQTHMQQPIMTGYE